MNSFRNGESVLSRAHIASPGTSIRFIERYMLAGRDWWGFGSALSLVVLALIAREAAGDLGSGVAPFVTLFPAIAISAVFFGPVATSVAAMISLLGIDYFWMEPHHWLRRATVGEQINLAGYVIGSALIIWAATELRAALERAREARTMLSLALATGRVGTWDLDPDTTLITASQTAYDLHGLRDTGLAQPLETWLRAVHPEDIAALRETLKSAGAGATDLVQDYRLLSTSGAFRWIRMRGSAVSQYGRRRLLCALVDTTDQAEHTAALQTQRDKAHAYFDIAGNILVVIGVDGAVMEINRRGVAVLGADTALDVIGRDWVTSHVPDESRDAVQSALRSVLVDGASVELETPIRQADGKSRRVIWRYARLHNGDGTTAIVASGVDVTELRETERALRQSEAGFRAVLHQIPAAAAVISAPSGQLVLQSDKTVELLGEPMPWRSAPGDVATGAANRRGHEGDAAISSGIARALAGEVVEAEAFTYRRPDGRTVTLEAYAAPVRDIDGTLIAAAYMAFDISERRRGEAELLAGRNRLDMALDAGSLGTWQIDIVSNEAWIGPRFAGMLALPAQPTNLKTSRLLGMIHPDDRLHVARLFRATVTTGKRFSDEFRIRTASGETRWVASQGVLLANGGSAIGVVRDVTHRREREDALREAIAARELLIREADHRIKNSLQLVVALLRLQQRNLADPEAARAVGGAISRVNAVAATHLALQKWKNLRSVAFGDMLHELCEQLSALAPNVDIVCEADRTLELDADRAIPLGLVISEVITNALRHAYNTGEAGLVTVSASSDGDQMRVRIRDYGRGMPDGIESCGLGSRVIKTMSAQIKATLAVDSQPGIGTIVTILLSLEADAAARDDVAASRDDG